ncbi:alkyl/aryl-sulfatase [Flavobacterium aquidurense]|uniref:Linear primary-alkylsulfatase n=1 Tax=Flavobacterium aquidurense TaxID=362413 RepID=A0A0Q0X260_9FLAO|nr:alkyl sulfatase dimerization domain-containing protein [Flavobacterium aquidurense]KQB42489.1 Alkyl sulfatase and related hydrolase [Flavobacterium aquidurense]
MKKIILCCSLMLAAAAAAQNQPKSNPPTSYTIAANKALYDYLDFKDQTDLKNVNKGLIAAYPQDTIGRFYNFKQFDFLKGTAPESVNPSLWRQSGFNATAGLFKVSEGIYQIRGFDLANMSVIRGKTGWIIIDPLTVKETVEAGMRLVRKHLEDLPVTAVIVTHSHMDHFGGMRGVVNEDDVKSGRIKIYAPEGFLEHSVSENLIAGNAMTRRAMYMYGNLLPKSATGSLGSGLGTTTASGTAGILDGTDIISSKEGETKIIDGIKFEFVYTPESEAPAEMMCYLPDYKAFMQAEVVNHTLHNLYTLRGAQVRNGQKWSMYIDKAIDKWGKDAQFSFGSHHWPTWGNAEVVDFLENQRDLFRFIHDQTVRMANEGMNPVEIANTLKLPKQLDTQFSNRGYYGTVSHNARAQYQLYFGFFDGNPANLNPLPPVEEGQKYVELMGGSENILKKAKESYDKGEYRWVAEIVNHVVFAEPKNQKARNLLADAYEQMGYQAESGPWRNFYLTGAQELRYGKKVFKNSSASNPDMVNGMSSEMFFNYLAMRYKGTEENTDKFNFNFELTDTKENVGLVISNGTVSTRVGSPIKDKVTATITGPRKALMALTGEAQDVTVDQLLSKGVLKVTGNKEAFKKFIGNIENFDVWFNLIEP